jgi:IclR family transcriptional regulator, KDG regulon repressor
MDRALDLLSRERSEWDAAGAARALGVSRSEAADALAVLASIGLLQADGDGYRLGWRNLTLASVLLRTSPFRGDGSRIVKELAEHSGETVLLAVWERHHIVCIARHDGERPLPDPFPEIGERLADTGTAAGKVLLAGRSAAARAELPRGVQLELDAIRTSGYACASEPLLPDVCSIAAPIVDRSGDVLAALSIAVPAARWRGAQLRHRRAVVRAAADVSRRLRRPRAATRPAAA